MKTIVPSVGITKTEYQKLFNKFQDVHGYMSKLVNKGSNIICGYLVRSEISDKRIPEGKTLIAISYHPLHDNPAAGARINARFEKAIAMNKVMIGGKRAVNQWLKDHESLENISSGSVCQYFRDPDSDPEFVENIKKYYNFDYREFYNYIISFENKIKKYYNDKEITIIVV